MRNTELSRSQQVIISAILSAAINTLIVLAVMLYQQFIGAWVLSAASLITALLVISLGQLVKEIIQSIRASEKQEKSKVDRWAVVHGDTLPHAAMPQQAQNGHRPQPVPVQFKDAASWLQ